ncbi:cytochrome P450 [Macrophomina phaseolina]|uniref:Cytochrome P450 n=1 Tax=Macrophomina phaseolina TaxID=35725 RepID=A0ABQ8FU56_9PEZI|nr:cytochrome P450 [Macrophomina phaseolina]
MAKARANWIVNGCQILEAGAKQGAFQVITASGPKIVLPNRYAYEIRNNPHMSFGKIITREFFSSYPGFEPFGTLNQHNVIQDATKNKLTQSLTLFTEEISQEVTKILDELLGSDEEWTEVDLRGLIARVIGQVTSRVFLGPELSRNKEWLELCQTYAVAGFAGQQALLSWSPVLRPFVYWFLPPCRQLRELSKVGHRVIQPYVDARRQAVQDAVAEGREPPKADNMIGWMDETAKGRRFNIADAQIMLSVAAIHTTTEASSWLMADLINHPEYAGPLREEVVSVIGNEGWQRNSLSRMKLHDSFIKESHRRHMVDALVMDRYVEKAVTLSDGLTLPAGSALMVHATNNLDEALWPNATRFDGYRFLRLRSQPGDESKYQFASISPEHLGFGLGVHACPGRFYAANTMKLMLAHLVMKYDWRFVDENPQLRAPFGSSVYVNPVLKVAAKRRKEEVSL